MRICLVGLGVIGPVHIDSILETGHRLTAVCDIDTEKAKRFLDLHGINAKVYSDYQKMLIAENPDVVHICTPHYLHADMSIFALEHGINVLCEKPLCIKIQDIPRIMQAERAGHAVLGVCHQNRYNDLNIYVKKILAEESVTGGFANVMWSRDKNYYDSADWRGKYATEGGGVMINQALHTLDLMQWFCGMPKTVTAHVDNLAHDFIEVEDTASASFEISGGRFDFYASTCQNTDFGVQIMLSTDKKRIIITDGYVIINGEIVLSGEFSHIGAKKCYGNGHVKLINDFYGCIEKKERFSLNTEESSKVILLINGMYQSDGRVIEI